MKRLSLELKPLFVAAAHAAFPKLSEAELLSMVALEQPRDPSHGDFACPVAFQLAKQLRQSPQAIGAQLVEHFPEDFRVGKVEFAAPGFVNLHLSERFLAETLKELEQGFQLESNESRKGPVIVDYTSTNAAKHIGSHHAITTFVGDALANLFEYMGHELHRINHLGDWGTQFGMLIYAVETWGDEAVIQANPTEELNKLYVKFNAEAEKQPELMDEARSIFKSLEEGDELRLAMWRWIVAESVRDLNRVFDRLGVHVDHIGESFYLKRADETIEDGIARGLFVEGERGALVFEMGEDQTPALIRKSDGATLYMTRDIATVKYRVETYHPDYIFYVVDHAQSLHFKQVFAASKALGYEGDTQLEHISFGRMSFADQSMSTRKGRVIKLETLLDEAVKRAADLGAERRSDLPEEEQGLVHERVGVSSIKYGILSQDRNKDVIFDWEHIITLEGNSAPYLLYSYARAAGIVEKLDETMPLDGLPKLSEDSERALIRHLILFPEALERAYDERKPHILCTYLYELAQSFNRFYGQVSVAHADTPEQKRSRLGLVHATLHQLKAGLAILGIPVLERM